VDDQDYQVPFKFTGRLSKLTIKIDRPQLTPEDEKRLMEAERNNKTSETPLTREIIREIIAK
jgi:arylsulfatase